MKRVFRSWTGCVVGLTLASLVLSACKTVSPTREEPSASAETTRSPAEQLEHFIAIFPGRYDSWQQWRDTVGSETRNYRRHSIFRHVDLPVFGDHVFLAHQYRDGDTQAVYRQRLYTLTLVPDRADAAFRLRVHVPKETAVLSGAYRDPSKLQYLGPDEFTIWDGCDLFWSWQYGVFVGTLDPGACRFTSAAFGQEIVLEETLTLSPDHITFADRGLSLDGDWLFGMRGDTPNISLKVRPFLCEAGDRTAWVHDQGGETDALGFPIRLEQFDGSDMTGLRLTVPRQDRQDVSVLDRRDTETITLDVDGTDLICRHRPDTLYTEVD